MPKLIAFDEEARRALENGMNKLADAGVVRSDERVVAYVTGHGLKTVEALTATVGPTATIAPTLEAFAAAVSLDSDLDRRDP